MGPQQPRFNSSPEQPRVNNPNIFRSPAPQVHERLPALMPERRSEQQPADTHEMMPMVPQQSLTLPALPTTVIAAPQPNPDTTVTAAPATAADEDLIEKDWVIKLKQIIKDTQDDPYQREQQVSALQRDYIYKRDGRKMGATEN